MASGATPGYTGSTPIHTFAENHREGQAFSLPSAPVARPRQVPQAAAMDRRPEPELMDETEQARAYAEADFEDPNATFCSLVQHRLGDVPQAARVVDLGCGPADIPRRLAESHPDWTITAVDAAPAMLAMARDHLQRSTVADRIALVTGRVPHLPLPAHSFDLVLSNSLLHHLADPRSLWQSIAQLGRTEGRVLVMDLRRPANEQTARDLVHAYAATEPEVLRRDFYNSFLAAYTVAEVEHQLAAAGLTALRASAEGDRHLVVWGHLPRIPTR